MNVYRITITRELLVMAKDEYAAKRLGVQYHREVEPDVNAYELTTPNILDRHERGSLVFHEGDDEITVEEAIARRS